MRLSSNATTTKELREELFTLLMLRAKQQTGLAGLTLRKSLKETHEYAAEVLGKIAGEVKCMELTQTSPAALRDDEGGE